MARYWQGSWSPNMGSRNTWRLLFSWNSKTMWLYCSLVNQNSLLNETFRRYSSRIFKSGYFCRKKPLVKLFQVKSTWVLSWRQATLLKTTSDMGALAGFCEIFENLTLPVIFHEIFSENSYQLKFLKYFCEKSHSRCLQEFWGFIHLVRTQNLP